MRRLISITLITTMMTALTPTTLRAAEDWRARECRYQYADGRTGWTPTEVATTIRCAAPRFGVSTATALAIAWRESHLGQYAVNPSSGACGVFQHIPRYFGARLRAVPSELGPFGHSCFNARDNVLAALWLARGGWGPWGLA
jgi:hypothetical protein